MSAIESSDGGPIKANVIIVDDSGTTPLQCYNPVVSEGKVKETFSPTLGSTVPFTLIQKLPPPSTVWDCLLELQVVSL